MAKTFRENSRQDFDAKADTGTTWKELQMGCLQRIADACEKMATASEKLARKYTDLEASCMAYMQMAGEQRADMVVLNRRIASLKGVITKQRRTLRAARECPDANRAG